MKERILLISEFGRFKPRKLWRERALHMRRIYVMLLNFLFGHDIVFSAIGWTAKNIFRKPIKNAFLLYPGHKKYSEAYVYNWYRNQMQWKPRLVGLLWQNGTLSLTFGISACDEDIWNDKGGNLRKVHDRMKHIKNKLQADQMSFAGIIPSVLMSKGIMSESVERKVTVPAIVKAVEEVIKREGMPDHTLIIVLGSKGFIGTSLVNVLRGQFPGKAIITIDLGNSNEFFRLSIESAVIVNVTKKGGLRQYIDHMHEGIVVLNEVYPAPRRNVVESIKDTGARIYHINGLEGGALPSFPHDYAGGIPCCAGYLPEKIKDLKVLVSKL